MIIERPDHDCGDDLVIIIIIIIIAITRAVSLKGESEAQKPYIVTCVRRRSSVTKNVSRRLDLDSSAPVRLTTTADMTSLAASGRRQNATKYCTKVRKTRLAGKESKNMANF